LQFLSVLDLAPTLLLGAALIILYLGQQLHKVMKRSETRKEDSDAYRVSLTAQALYELRKPATNLTSVLEVMREELRAACGGATEMGKEFLTSSLPQSNEHTDAARFLELYADYKTAMNQIRRRSVV